MGLILAGILLELDGCEPMTVVEATRGAGRSAPRCVGADA